MQLVDGAHAIREDLPSTARREVPVPLEAGDGLGTPVARLSSVLQALSSAREIIREIEDAREAENTEKTESADEVENGRRFDGTDEAGAAAGPAPAGESASAPIAVGGDCSSSLAGLAAAVERHGAEKLAVLWFDAHADMQHPSTSPSGAAAGMTLRHALGDGVADLAFTTPISDSMLTLIGARTLDDEEAAEVESREIRVFPPVPAASVDVPASPRAALDSLSESVRALLSESGATHVYIHVDLDVLDPAEFSSVSAPVPFGLTIAQLTDAIRAAVQSVPVAAASIAGFQPRSPDSAGDDLPTLLRLLGALTSGSAR